MGKLKDYLNQDVERKETGVLTDLRRVP